VLNILIILSKASEYNNVQHLRVVNFQILCSIGSNLEALDLSGGLMSPITDEGLVSISKYCTSLTRLGLSMLKVTGSTIVPMLQNSDRAGRFKTLHLSCKSVRSSIYILFSDKWMNMTSMKGTDFVCSSNHYGSYYLASLY